jgi:hypothetical protein
MFKSAGILTPLYDCLSCQSVLVAEAPRVASFLGKKITPALAQEIGSRLSTRIEGHCIKHSMGAASVNVHDKFSCVLRIETKVNDVSFFKPHRKVEHRDGHSTRELAGLKTSLYSLIDSAIFCWAATSAIWAFSPASTIPAQASVTCSA